MFLDNYAAKQMSPEKMSSLGMVSGDVQRLMQERKELIYTAQYAADDPVILEYDRNIKIM